MYNYAYDLLELKLKTQRGFNPTSLIHHLRFEFNWLLI